MCKEIQQAKAIIENQKKFSKDQMRIEALIRSLSVQVSDHFLSVISGYVSIKGSMK
jgi:hypothetical protein